jgi:hypothetical protein
VNAYAYDISYIYMHILMMNQSFIEFVLMESLVNLARREKIKNMKDQMMENVKNRKYC